MHLEIWFQPWTHTGVFCLFFFLASAHYNKMLMFFYIGQQDLSGETYVMQIGLYILRKESRALLQ